VSGRDAARQLLKDAEHEEFLAADLVARALGCGNRQVLRDWRRRQLPELRVGRTILFPARIVVETYLYFFSVT